MIRGWGLKTSVAAALVLVASACSGSARSNGDGLPAPNAAITVMVQNNAFADMDIYAISPGGFADWVGFVPGSSSDTLTLRQTDFPDGTVRLLAHPIGGRGVARTGPLLVGPGEKVSFTIMDPLRLSFATVRGSRS